MIGCFLIIWGLLGVQFLPGNETDEIFLFPIKTQNYTFGQRLINSLLVGPLVWLILLGSWLLFGGIKAYQKIFKLLS